MKKSSLILLIFLAVTALKAQVGVNTENPQGIFHIDGKRDTNGSTNIADDVMVDTQGRIGIGTNAPQNKIDIRTTGNNTGLHLPNGASSGKVLTSDTQGNGVWVSGAVQYQTMVVGKGGNTIYSGIVPYPESGPSIGKIVKIDFFNNIKFDKAKEIYGSTYGWDAVNQRYVAPVTGIYRISMNMYFRSTQPGENQRVYAFKNGVFFQDPGFISVTDNGKDQNNFVMGLVKLDQGDIIDFWGFIYNNAQSEDILLYGEEGHSYILIESL
ncbi:hypothetical protein [Dysgonomonas sp. 520]|uniref:hypothetical protein n=1 Tax=Dysgonomonas sp. 520 TaxID=2302931 RepID=UPI0013D158DB|nr:hypothetical protein [Dysgonomonas sp. 520]NDW08669.1 hypothetical protein [Dysgonomonas sp. 520]